MIMPKSRDGPLTDRQKLLEYYDSRGAVMFFDEMHSRPFMGGTITIQFLWDEMENRPVQL